MYWLPVWHILEDDFELTLCNARHVKNVPGRKTDVNDAEWLCQLMEAGLLRGSFVAPKPQRRSGADPVSQDPDRRAPARGQPAAQGARGHRDQARLRRHRHPRRLRPGDARRARCRHHRPRGARRSGQGKLRAKIPALREALQGRFEAHHALIIGAILSHLDFLDEQIAQLSDAIEAELGPSARRRHAGRHDHRRRRAHRRGRWSPRSAPT